MDRILRIDVGTPGGPTITTAPLGEYAGLGGRAMASRIIAQEVPASCHPLGSESKLVLAPGLLCGAADDFSSRLAIGCKSPLGNVLETVSIDGPAARHLAHLHYAAVIIEGQRQTDDLFSLVISRDAVSLVPDNSLRMLPICALHGRLKPFQGEQAALLAIGTAGEMLMASATLAVADSATQPVWHTGRGVGAVMGAKGIKCIRIDATGASRRMPVNPDQFAAAATTLKPDGARHAAFPGNTPRAMPQILAANCGIDDHRDIARLVFLHNNFGLDPMELCASITLLMHAGVIQYGDAEGAIRLVEEAGKGSPLGRIVGAGAATVARGYGIEHAPAERLETPPGARPAPGLEVSATTPDAALNAALDAASDALGLCPETAPAAGKAAWSAAMAEAINGMFGQTRTSEDVITMGQRILAWEHDFNAASARCGMPDRLAQPCSQESLIPHSRRPIIPAEELDKVMEC
ncbi:aldehyde ferredoxin oxidoreductase N-terminal domain-containing protein [Megalodesulfovibrio paquesii]